MGRQEVVRSVFQSCAGNCSARFHETAGANLDALATFLAGIAQQGEIHAWTDLFDLGVTAQRAKHRALATAHAGTAGKATFDLGQELILGDGADDLGFAFDDALVTHNLIGFEAI